MITLENLSVVWPDFELRDVSFQIDRGEFFALLGPTGSGKTVVLESIAGLVRPTTGSIRVAGRDVTRLAPERRQIGIVYQDYSLFPHLTVLENIRFGLRYLPPPQRPDRAWLDGLIELLDLRRILHRQPLNLSGGEKQRTSLARALAVKPSVLLLDEPLAALDPRFRDEIRYSLKQLHNQLDTTLLMVTHDFDEALYLAGRVGILSNGRMEQVGLTEEIFQRPATPFVAAFVGMKNIFPGRICNEMLEFAGLCCPLPGKLDDGQGHVALRPEDIVLCRQGHFAPPLVSFPGVIERIVPAGLWHELSVRCHDTCFTVVLGRKELGRKGFSENEVVRLGFDPADLHVIKEGR
ncbi:MAG: ABC transporter ATP-binding protein [Geobacteraceae bacterium]